MFANGRPGKFPTLEELYNKCFPGETFPAHDALEDVKACKRCIPVLVENGIIELKPKECPAEQLKFNPEPEPAKTKKVKREVFTTRNRYLHRMQSRKTRLQNC